MAEKAHDPADQRAPGCEIGGEETPAGLEDALDLSEAAVHHALRQVVEHKAAQDDVKLLIVERQLLDRRAAKVDIVALLCRFLPCSLKHFGRRVDSGDIAGPCHFGGGQYL